MRLENIAGIAFDHFFGRLLKRALVAIVIAACTLAAVYHFTAAGTLALQAQYGALNASLIVGAIYSTVAVMGCVALWATGKRPANTGTPALGTQAREMQLVMLVEAVMLGYALARKTGRAS